MSEPKNRTSQRLTRSPQLAMYLLLLYLGCAGAWSQQFRVGVRYKPPVVPISVSIDSTGNVSVRLDGEIVTPVGSFTIFGAVSENVSGSASSAPTLTILSGTKRQVYRLGAKKYRVVIPESQAGRSIISYDKASGIIVQILPRSLSLSRRASRSSCSTLWSRKVHSLLALHSADAEFETSLLRGTVPRRQLSEAVLRTIVEDYEGAGSGNYCSYKRAAYKFWGCSEVPGCAGLEFPQQGKQWSKILQKRADRLESKGRMDLEARVLDRAVTADPGSSFAWGSYSVALLQLNHYKEAAEAAVRAAEIDPRFSPGLLLLLTQVERNVSLDEAAKVADVMVHGSSNWVLFEARANILLRQGRVEAAADGYAKALSLEPGDTSLLKTASHVFASAGRDAEAESALTRASSLLGEREPESRDRRFRLRRSVVSDRRTGLSWTRWDTGVNVNWTEAKVFCSSIAVGGFHDWRLPSVAELETLYDPRSTQPGTRESVHIPSVFVVTAPMLLSANSEGVGVRVVDFVTGDARGLVPKDNPKYRALCVRSEASKSRLGIQPQAKVAEASTPAQVVRDPSSGRYWTTRDNGRDVDWYNAVAYCNRLRLGGFDDWRLPTTGELDDLYNRSVCTQDPRHPCTLRLGIRLGKLWLWGGREIKGLSNSAWAEYMGSIYGTGFRKKHRRGMRALCVRP